MGGQFHSNGGEQNIGQGQNAVGKQENNHGPVISTTGDQAPAVNAQGDVTITYGVPFEKYEQVRDECERLKVEYGIKDVAFASFFRILNQENIPCAEWGAKLPEIAFRYKELLLRFEAVTSDDPQVKSLKEQARQAIEDGDYDQADALLNQAKERDRAAVATLKASLAEQQAALEKRQLSEAQSCVEQAELQRLQYRYEKSAQYFQEAASALPEGRKKERAEYLGAAGYDLLLIDRYADALNILEQSLSIFREIGDLKGEGTSLNNIGRIYNEQGEYCNSLIHLEKALQIFLDSIDKKIKSMVIHNMGILYLNKYCYDISLKYFNQSLVLRRNIYDKKGEGASLNNIGIIHHENGDYASALQCYEQALAISRESLDKRTEGAVLNCISQLYKAQGKFDTALEYLEKSLVISMKIGNRKSEGLHLNNIGNIYENKGDYTTALNLYEQSLTIANEIDDKKGKARVIWNLWRIYIKQNELAKAKECYCRGMELLEQLQYPKLQEWRITVKGIRFRLWMQQCLFVRVFRSLIQGRQQNSTSPSATMDKPYDRNTP